MTDQTSLFEAVFGAVSQGATAEQRAQSSNQLFVRSQHQLTLHVPGAKGRTLSAREALREFGWTKLSELADRPAIPILRGRDEPYATLERRLKALGLSFSKVATRLAWTKEQIKAFEQRRQITFRKLEQMAQVLALNEEMLGIEPDARGDRELGVRLREIKGGNSVKFSDSTVLGLSEAAWIVRKQRELAGELDSTIPNRTVKLGFNPTNDYGSPNNPAWRIGYELALRTRDLLGLDRRQPIGSLKELIEHRLGVPVIQMDLPPSFAGATVANGESRGIVVNLQGLNQNVWVRRMTLAHELGHLLWDPDHRLRKLIVDQYADLDLYADLNNAPRSDRDFVEMRANGFAIEFLAPRDAVRIQYENVGEGRLGIEAVMSTYGISKTAATYHLENAFQRTLDLSMYRSSAARGDNAIHLEPSADWKGREELAVDFFKPKAVPVSRRGRFAAYVSKHVEKGLCSRDTAAALLQCAPDELEQALQSIASIIDQEPVI